MISAAGPRRILLLYAQKDKKYGDELFRHLKPLVESHAITLEGPHAIQAGEDKEHVLKQKLEAANWLIVLLSSDLLSSEAEASALRILSSIRDEEIESKSHQESASRIIPIYIRDVELGDTIFEPLQRLPRNGRSISSTKNRDKTWKGIVTELRTRFNDANSTPQGDQVFADMDDAFPRNPEPKNGRSLPTGESHSHAQREYATAAAALATVTARTGCIGWKTELIEIYALLWDGYHTNPPDDSLTHCYLVDRVHQLCHELEDSPKTSDAMKSRLQTLRTQYPSLFEESNAV